MEEKGHNSYDVDVIYFKNGYSVPIKTQVDLEADAIRFDSKTTITYIPYNAILKLDEDHHSIILTCIHVNKFVIRGSDNTEEIVNYIQNKMDEIGYDKTSAIETRDAIGNVTYNSKKFETKSLIIMAIIVAICVTCFVSCSVTSSKQVEKAKRCLARIYPKDADKYSCSYTILGPLVNCKYGIVELQLYDSTDGNNRYIVRGNLGNGQQLILNNDCFGRY